MRVVRASTLGFYMTVAVILGAGAGVVGARATPFGAWLGLVPPAVVAWFGLKTPIRRWNLARLPLPQEWEHWLEAHIPFYRHLSEDARSEFDRNVRFFLEEHTFEGLQGLHITDELRLSVAAGAALMLHGRPDWELPRGRTLLFYPDTFDDSYGSGKHASYEGMVHPQGPIIFSTHAVYQSWADPHDGFNVVLHELAHLFDFENAAADGVPSLLDRASEAAWQQLVKREMNRVRLGKSILDSYAATHPAEFFAVAVENFFERPILMRREHPELFQALIAFFNLDPVVPGSA